MLLVAKMVPTDSLTQTLAHHTATIVLGLPGVGHSRLSHQFGLLYLSVVANKQTKTPYLRWQKREWNAKSLAQQDRYWLQRIYMLYTGKVLSFFASLCLWCRYLLLLPWEDLLSVPAYLIAIFIEFIHRHWLLLRCWHFNHRNANNLICYYEDSIWYIVYLICYRMASLQSHLYIFGQIIVPWYITLVCAPLANMYIVMLFLRLFVTINSTLKILAATNSKPINISQHNSQNYNQPLLLCFWYPKPRKAVRIYGYLPMKTDPIFPQWQDVAPTN